jgi:glycosyltransferase involved in cell wall biosynthesis
VAEFVKDYHNCPKTLDYMDAFSKGIERRIENANFFTKLLFKKEAKRLSLYERQIFDYFENHTIISNQDKEYILHPRKNSITCIQNGVDASFFEKQNKTNEFDFVFTGNMSYKPNIEAANYIIEEILPLLNTDKTSYSLLISGANPHSSIMKLARNNSNIKITGWVNDIRSSYLKGKIFIAPMMIGTGMQNKLIEAMAMGLPCITTPLANNAIHAIHNQSIIVAENKFEFVSGIQKLLTDENFYLKISEGGRKLALSNFDWEKTTKKLINLFDNKNYK